jgi:excinuclease ABC subunit C
VLLQQLDFHPERDREAFAAAPAAPAVFLLRGEEGSEPYVSKTANLRRRLLRLLGSPEERTRRLNLRERARRIEYALTGSDFESALLLYKLLRATFPKTYKERLRLRPAPLARLHLDNPYPRMSITTHLSGARSADVYYGPFASRAAAEKFANDALDFFKMRRCVDDLHPDPAFPGCIYSEMKMCLAPCFKGCSDEEYAGEVARVQQFFDSRGQSLVRELGAERDQASARLEFEAAAALHARVDKLQPVLSQLPEVTRRLDRLAALIVQPSALPESVALFRVAGGCLSDPIAFNLKLQEGGKPLSMEARAQETLAAAPAMPRFSKLETMEHLAMLKRWYFRSSKTGEIFFADEKGDLPWRRIVRGISRVFRGEKPAEDLSETARDYWLNRARETGI